MGRAQNTAPHMLTAQKAEHGPLLPVVTGQRVRKNSLILTKDNGSHLISEQEILRTTAHLRFIPEISGLSSWVVEVLNAFYWLMM